MKSPKTFIRTVSVALTMMLAATPVRAGDIVDTAISAGSFKILVAAVKVADLVSTLKSKGPFTVFAPTDAAFANLPAGTIASLLKPENKAKLVAILTYHVMPGKVMASDIAGKSLKVASVQGSKIAVEAYRGVMVDKTKVVKADVKPSNGVIHVIDTVIMPNM
ncbi:MAG: fasciclin domain-containing protein [Alphaproteobacteria bacterium]